MPIETFGVNVTLSANDGNLSIWLLTAKLRRLDYTVIGDVVNVAQRLQSAAKPGQIIINENAYEKIKESFKCSKVGEVSLKHKSTPQTIYEVMD